MDLKVKQDTYNPLLKRKEVNIEVDHESQGTPSRLELRKAVASKYNTKPENVFVVDVETRTGTQNAVCAVEVYDDAEIAKQTVPEYIQVRNLPPEERKKVREEQAKKEEPKPKPEKPKAGKPVAEAKPEKPPEEGKEAKPKAEGKPASEVAKKGKDSESK